MQMGLMTPPFGLLLFTMKGVAPACISLRQIIVSVIPFLCISLLIMTLVFFWPGIATWLPSMLG